MFEINLIQDRSITPEIKKNENQQLIAVIGIMFVLCFFVCIISFISIARANKYKKILRKVDTNIQSLIKKYNIDKWSKNWKKYSWKIEVMKNILDDRRVWVPVFTELARILPEKSAIENLAYSPENATITVLLNVLAESGFEMQRVNQLLELSKRSRAFPMGSKIVDQKRGEIDSRKIEFFKILIPLKKEEQNPKQKSGRKKRKSPKGH